jgi:hypothetical protein
MITQVGYSVVGLSRGWVTLCVVCTVHVETRSVGFLVKPQNQGRRFISDLASKPLGRFLIGLGIKIDSDGLSVVWPQNHCVGLSVVWPQNHWDGFLRFGLKPVTTISSGLASKSAATVYGSLVLKHAVTVSVTP